VRALLVASVGLAACETQRDSPGLVLITIDTCRADRVGPWGRAGVTPHLERLAERGTVFLDAAAPVPLTLPSHATIHTGLYPDRHRVRDNGSAAVPEEATTLAERLRAEGWRTGAFVSAFPLDASFGLGQGFEVYDDSLTGSSSAGVPPGGSQDMSRRLFYDERSATEVVDAALPWLRETRDSGEPFFLWVHFFDPHATYRPPREFASGDPYQGEISYVDAEIGRLLAELDQDRERVTVCVTADHGESLGDHGEVTHALFVYRSTLHVPWILAGPRVPSARIERPVSLVQVMPTLLAAVGLDDAGDGIDLDGESAFEDRDVAVFGESLYARMHYDWAGLRTVRSGPWKLIEAPEPELYQLHEDPNETQNLAAVRADVVEELSILLDEHEARGGELAATQRTLDESERARLQGLGYVGGGTSPSDDADLWNPSGRDPKSMVGFFNRLQEVATLMIAGRNDEASAELEALRELDPRNRNVLEKLALLRKTEGRLDEARAYCEEILRIQPEDTANRLNLASVWVELGDLAGAKREYRAVVEHDARNVDGWSGLAAVQSMAGEAADALASRQRAVEIRPDDADLRVALAEAWRDVESFDRAIDEYDRVLAEQPAHVPARIGKASLLARMGRARDAVAVLREGLAHTPRDVDTLNNLAWTLTNESLDPEEGLRVARRAIEIAPDDPATLDTLGWSLIRAGHPAEAVAPLERAWSETGDAEVRVHLGIALAEVGREPEGRAHLEAAVAERPEFRELPEVSRWLP